MTAPVRLVIADDHPVFRFGLRAALDGVREVEVVGEAADGAALVALAERTAPDVVLTDLAMPGVDGRTAIERVLRTSPPPAVLVLTMHADDDALLGALAAGARGYLLKGAERDDIVRAVLTVAAGGAVYGAGIGQRITGLALGNPTSTPQHRFPGLTVRELEVLALVAEGLGNHEVARRLVLSEKTVRNHVANVLTKLGVRDRAAAVARARDGGLGAPRRNPQ